MAKFKVGDKVKVYHGTKEGKVLSVEEGMRGPFYKVQLGTLHGVPIVSMIAEKELVAANSSACNAPGVDPKRMIAYIKKIVSSINLKAFTGAHGPEIRYNGIPWEYGVALNPYSPEEVVVSAHTWKDAPKDDIKDMEEKVKRDTEKLVSKLNATGFSATPRFYFQTKVPIYILGEISAQHKGQNSVQPESASACNTLRPYGSWRAASRGNVHVGDYVIHKAQYASFKDDEEKLDRNSERVAGVQSDGFWTDMSGTNELERYGDYYVFNAARACNSTNPIVRKAMNAQYEYHTYLVPVIRKGVKDYVTIERVADEETAKKLVDVPSFRIIGVTVDETRPVKVAKNATALNFSPGDKVSIVDTDIRYGGDKGEVVRKDGFRYVVRLTSRQDKPEVLLQPNQIMAANAEDAQGHEHGDDGKFTSKDSGSSGDGYEDPKTKRMKERLAKMREKNEALRKDIEARKAGLAQKKADTEKMRADIMKANVEKWKAGLPKTKNAIVAKAMNATALNYSPYSKGGWLHDDKGANYTVVEEEHWGKDGGAERFVTIRDEATKQTKEVPVTELAHRFHMGEAEACAKCGNAVARNAVGRDKQDAGEVETWVNMFRNFIDWHLPKYKDMEKARKSGEQIIKYVEACLGSEGGKAQLRKMGWTVQKMRETMEKAIASRKGSNASCNAARSRNAVVQKALNAVANAITGTGRVNYDDDLIAVYNPNGQQVYKGSVDDCPYKNDDWKYDASTRTYRVDGPNGDYRTIAKVSNAVAKNDWVADRTGDYTWRETAKERGIKSALRAAGASYANYLPVNRGSVERMNYDSLSWVVRADESVIDKVAQKMKQLGMEEVSKPTWHQYDEYTVIGYTKIKPMPKNAVAKNAHDIDAHGHKLGKGDWVRFVQSMPSQGGIAAARGDCAEVVHADAAGLIFRMLKGAGKISWDASVVEKMPPPPMSLTKINEWKVGPAA